MFIYSTIVLIRYLWQLKTFVFMHWCIISAVLLKQSGILCSKRPYSQSEWYSPPILNKFWMKICRHFWRIRQCSTESNEILHSCTVNRMAWCVNKQWLTKISSNFVQFHSFVDEQFQFCSCNKLQTLVQNFAFYKKSVVVQNKSNWLLKIFCETFKHYNS